MEWTQLQFIVEARPGGDVQTSYRAYAQDSVVELWKKNQFIFPQEKSPAASKLLSSWRKTQFEGRHYDYVPVDVEVKTYVMPGKGVLKRHPDGHPRAGLPMIPSGELPPTNFSMTKIDRKGKETKDVWSQVDDVINHMEKNATMDTHKVRPAACMLCCYRR